MAIDGHLDANPPSIKPETLPSLLDPQKEIKKIGAQAEAQREFKDLGTQLDTLNIMNPTEFENFIENLEKLKLNKGERIATWVRLLQRLNLNLVGIKKMNYVGGKPSIELFGHKDSKVSVAFLGSYQRSINKFLELGGGNTSEFFTAAMARTSNFSDFLIEEGKKGVEPNKIKARDHFRNLIRKSISVSENMEEVIMTTKKTPKLEALVETVLSSDVATQADKEYIRLYMDSLEEGKKGIKVDLPGKEDLKKVDLTPFAGKIEEVSANKKLLGKGPNKLQDAVGGAVSGVILGYLFGQLRGGKGLKNYAIAFGIAGALYGGAVDQKTKDKAKYVFGRTLGLMKEEKKADDELTRQFGSDDDEEVKNISIADKYRDIAIPKNITETQKQYYDFSYESIFKNSDFLNADTKTLLEIFDKHQNFSDIKDSKYKDFLLGIGLGENFLFDSRNYKYYREIIQSISKAKKGAIGEPKNGESFINYLSRTDKQLAQEQDNPATTTPDGRAPNEKERTHRTEMLNLSSKDLLKKLSPNSLETEKIAHNLELYNIDLKGLLFKYFSIIDLCNGNVQEKLKQLIFIRIKSVSDYIDERHKSYFQRNPTGNDNMAVAQYKRMVSSKLNEELGEKASNPTLSEIFFDAMAYSKYLNGNVSDKMKLNFGKNFEAIGKMFNSEITKEGKFKVSQKGFSKEVNSADLELSSINTDFSDYLKVLTKEEESIEFRADMYSLIVALLSIGGSLGTVALLATKANTAVAVTSLAYQATTFGYSQIYDEDFYLSMGKKLSIVDENYRKDPTATDNIIAAAIMCLTGVSALGGIKQSADMVKNMKIIKKLLDKINANGGVQMLVEYGKRMGIKGEYLTKVYTELIQKLKTSTIRTDVANDIFNAKAVNFYNNMTIGASFRLENGISCIKVGDGKFKVTNGTTVIEHTSESLREYMLKNGTQKHIDDIVYGAKTIDDALFIGIRNSTKGIGKITQDKVFKAMEESIAKGNSVKIGNITFDTITKDGGKIIFNGKDSAGVPYMRTIDDLFKNIDKNSISDIYVLLLKTNSSSVVFNTSKLGPVKMLHTPDGMKAIATNSGKVLSPEEIKILFNDKAFLKNAADEFIKGIIAFEKSGGSLLTKVDDLFGKAGGFIGHGPIRDFIKETAIRPGMTLWELLMVVFQKEGIKNQAKGVGSVLAGGTRDGVTMKDFAKLLGAGAFYTATDRLNNNEITPEKLYKNISELNPSVIIEIMLRGLTGWASLFVKG